MKSFSRDSIKARFTQTKECGFKSVLRNENGAIDLASIMVGVIVVGIVGSVIAASVFAVIPWSQDQAAAQDLDAVRTAQSVAQASSAAEGPATFLEKAALVNGVGTLDSKPLLQDSDSVAVVVSGGEYYAVSQSATGKYFGISSEDPTNVKEAADLAGINTALSVPVADAVVAGDFANAKS